MTTPRALTLLPLVSRLSITLFVTTTKIYRVAWASILAMQYVVLTDAMPAGKFGIYMGIFNFFIVLPQIMASTIYGGLLHGIFGGEPIFVLVTGGVSFLVAAALMNRLK